MAQDLAGRPVSRDLFAGHRASVRALRMSGTRMPDAESGGSTPSALSRMTTYSRWARPSAAHVGRETPSQIGMSASITAQLLISPYGDAVCDLLVPAKEVDEARARAGALPSLQLSDRSACDLELLACGAFSPLDRVSSAPLGGVPPACRGEDDRRGRPLLAGDDQGPSATGGRAPGADLPALCVAPCDRPPVAPAPALAAKPTRSHRCLMRRP